MKLNIKNRYKLKKMQQNVVKNLSVSTTKSIVGIVNKNTDIIDAEKYNQAFLESSPDPLVIIDLDGKIKHVNSATVNATGLSRNKMIGTHFSEYFTDKIKASAVFEKAYHEGKAFDYELELCNISGHSTPVLYNASVYKDDKGRIIGVFAAVRDITNIKENEDELIYLKNNLELLILERSAELVTSIKDLEHQTEENEKIVEELSETNEELERKNEEILFISNHDTLTGLFNRVHFDIEKNRFDIEGTFPISIIIADINGLKLINDGFGNSKGDEVIIEVANILKECCREEDIVARIGGDEFGILLPKTDNKSAQLISSRIYEACRDYSLNGDIVYPSVAVGYATKTNEIELVGDVFRAAEESMLRKKMLESKSANSSIISAIKTAMFEKSHETAKHAERLIQLSKMIGEALSLSDQQLDDLQLFATLHDIGKVSIDDNILSKKGPLSDEEWITMKKHPGVGFRIAMASPELEPIANYILAHHERWDGKGYPHGLKEEEIPLISRILSIADAYDAMISDRSYRKAMTEKDAIEEIRINAGSQFDPIIAKLFIKLIS